VEVGQEATDDYPPLRLEVAGSYEPTHSMPDYRPPPRKAPPAPLEGTLQFLPGRMEIVEGRDVGQEIRFVKSPGPDGTTVTFGRAEGVPYRHVQLHEPTVSRHHAKMNFEAKNWRLTNLSATNPVVVNGIAMNGDGDSLALQEGDKVEMGEVVFRFRVK
jgi:pSer/pThr/pTyr-binding forkhead associated (FHA) protein